MKDEMTEFLGVAWQAASAAGEIIRASWQQPKTIGYKGAIDLVTSVDRESEHVIVEIVQQNFPDHSILAEEETRVEGTQTDWRWIIDPLDGTTNFAHGYPQFCLSIALERKGNIVLGLVFDPLRRECFRAVSGQGATLNGDPIAVSTEKDLDKALLATGFPYDHREQADFYLSYFKTFMTRCQGIRRGGSAALDLSYLACGRLDGFWEMKLKPWDTAAGVLIVAEAGGTITDFSGDSFSVYGDQTLASNGLLQAQMLAALKSIAD